MVYMYLPEGEWFLSDLFLGWVPGMGSHDLSSRPQPKRVLGACACCAEQTSMWVPT